MRASSATPADRHRRRNPVLSDLRRAEILTAATKVFGRKGFEATRADDIAAAAHIAKGTLYLYFPSKEAMYTAAVSQAVRALQEELDARVAAANSFERKLTAAIEVRLEFWPAHDAVYRLLMTVGRGATHRKQTNAILSTAHSTLMAIFAGGVERGEIKADDFAPLAWAAIDMMRGASERRVDRVGSRSPQQDAAWITACVLRQVQLRPALAKKESL